MWQDVLPYATICVQYYLLCSSAEICSQENGYAVYLEVLEKEMGKMVVLKESETTWRYK